MSERLEKINATLHEYIGDLIQKELDYSQEYLITITRVDTSPDLKNATVFVSVLPDNRRGSAIELLSRSAGRIKSGLYKLMKTKNVPNLHFKIDEQEVFAQRVDAILDELSDH